MTIALGAKVKDIVTGFAGTVTGRCEYMTGCNQPAAKSFLESMPAMDTLMPPVEIGEIQSLIEAKRAARRNSLDFYN